jgi:hypothetical protein
MIPNTPTRSWCSASNGTNPFDKLLMAAGVPENRITEFGAWRFWTGGHTEWSDNNCGCACGG